VLDTNPDYWTEVFASQQRTLQPTWRAYSDALHQSLLSAWWNCGKADRVLKTDLFEEALGTGLSASLRHRACHVIGLDFSPQVAAVAVSRCDGLIGIGGDVRRLPFGDAVFDGVISTSTLDHFASAQGLVDSLHEISRVMRPGGLLILTLDNPANPIICLRQILPFRLLNRLGIVPYFVGYACRRKRLHSFLSEAGFRVREFTAICHCPRLLAILAARWFDQHGTPRGRDQFCRMLLRFERLAGCGIRYVTGHFLACRAEKL
jgi:SAM-dependent methyltransferase